MDHYPFSFKIFSLFLEALLAPKLRFVVMCPVIISRSNQPVTPSNPVTVHTGDTLLNPPTAQ